MITADRVRRIHDDILSSESGLAGAPEPGKLEGALARIDNAIAYAAMIDVFDIAALYATALARGHCFNDANKRTALVVTLVYLELQGVTLERSPQLEDIMVDVADGSLPADDLAALLYTLSQP